MVRPVKAPFSYYGGKTTLAPRIAELLPEHAHYVEPFAGSLAVLLAKKPSKAETVNDLDGDLMTFWRVLRDAPEALRRAAELTPHSREEYRVACAGIGTAGTDLERARRVFVLLTQGRSHSMKPTGWYTRRDSSKSSFGVPRYLDAYVGRIESCAERIANVSLECRDALDVIRDYGTEPTVCIYADPPYLGSTRASNYKHEMLGADAHETFAAILHDCKAAVVLSGYASPLYEELFPGWYRAELTAPATLSGRPAENEILWSNRPLGLQEAFDFTVTEDTHV